MLPTHDILSSIVYWNSRWCYRTRRKSYTSLYNGSVISDWTTLMLYHQAQFIAYNLYHHRLLMGKILSSETSGSFYYQKMFMSQRLCIRNCSRRCDPILYYHLYMVHGLYLKKGLSRYLKCIVEVVYDIWIAIVLSDVVFIKVCFDVLTSSPTYLWQTTQSFSVSTWIYPFTGYE